MDNKTKIKRVWVDTIKVNNFGTTVTFDYFTPEYPEKLSILKGTYTYNFITKDANIKWESSTKSATIDYNFLHNTLYNILEKEGLCK